MMPSPGQAFVLILQEVTFSMSEDRLPGMTRLRPQRKIGKVDNDAW